MTVRVSQLLLVHILNVFFNGLLNVTVDDFCLLKISISHGDIPMKIFACQEKGALMKQNNRYCSEPWRWRLFGVYFSRKLEIVG